jgi:hypothetical protein
MKCKRCPNEARRGRKTCMACADKRRAWDTGRECPSMPAQSKAQDEADDEKALQWLRERGHRQ